MSHNRDGVRFRPLFVLARPVVNEAALASVREAIARVRKKQMSVRGKRPRDDDAGALSAVKRLRVAEAAAAAARGKRKLDVDAGGDAKRRRVAEAPAAGGRKRKRVDDGGRTGKRKAGVGFVTKGGKVVSFMPKGTRRAKLMQKLASGEAKCMINPKTGRAVREGSSAFKKAAKEAKKPKMMIQL